MVFASKFDSCCFQHVVVCDCGNHQPCDCCKWFQMPPKWKGNAFNAIHSSHFWYANGMVQWFFWWKIDFHAPHVSDHNSLPRLNGSKRFDFSESARRAAHFVTWAAGGQGAIPLHDKKNSQRARSARKFWDFGESKLRIMCILDENMLFWHKINPIKKPHFQLRHIHWWKCEPIKMNQPCQLGQQSPKINDGVLDWSLRLVVACYLQVCIFPEDRPNHTRRCTFKILCTACSQATISVIAKV